MNNPFVLGPGEACFVIRMTGLPNPHLYYRRAEGVAASLAEATRWTQKAAQAFVDMQDNPDHWEILTEQEAQEREREKGELDKGTLF